MIIARACVKPLRASLRTPFRIATGQHESLDNLLFVIELQNGIKGYGEAAIAPHITGETVFATEKNLKEAAAVCPGEDITDHRAFVMAFREKFADNHAGLAALEMAVLDAWTRSLKIPLWKLFGAVPKPLRSDITIVIGSLDEAAASAKFYSRLGFRAFKVKVGSDPDLDLARVLAVSKNAPRGAIILDANQGFSTGTMLGFIRQLKRRKVCPVLLEQPVPKGDWDGLKKVTDRVRRDGILVCADESVRTLSDALRAVREKAVTAINVKCMKSGILQGEEIARTARAAGMELMMGAMMETSLAITAAAHMASGMGCFKFIDLDTTYFLKGPLVRSPYLDDKGCFDLSRASAGIGVSPLV